LSLEKINIPYPDFTTGGVIDPEQFDENNSAIGSKINEIVVSLNPNLQQDPLLLVEVGEYYWGGKIAYILQSGDVGYDADVQKGFIISDKSLSSKCAWSTGTKILNGNTSVNLGTGNANTIAMMAQSGYGTGAATVCEALSVVINGVTYSDWYLPSKSELEKIFTNRETIWQSGEETMYYWWSSSENDLNTAHVIQFYDDGEGLGAGTAITVDKNSDTVAYARAIRSFTNALSVTEQGGLTSENIIDGSITDLSLGNRTISDTIATTTASTGTLTQLLSWLAKQIKAIIGGAGWASTPPDTLTGLDTRLTSAEGNITTDAAALATHKTSSDHDGRYYTETELNAGQLDTRYYTETEIGVLDAANVKLTGNQTVAGVKTFSSSPIIPTPTTDMQAATKAYADGVTQALATHKTSADHDGRYYTESETDTLLSGKEAANANIQAHVTSAHAPSDAQKNSDITIAEIEAKLTGDISTHNHNGTYYTETEIAAKLDMADGAIKSVGGVTNAKGNIGFVGGVGIIVTPDNTEKTITITATGGTAPANHASTHAISGGSDPVSAASIGAAAVSHASTHSAGGADALTGYAPDLRSIEKEPTGFVNRTDSNISIATVSATTTFTIAPASTTFDYYAQGTKYTVSAAQTVEIPDTMGLWYIYYVGATLTASQTFPGMFVPLVAICYWNSTTKKSLLSDERHGLSMDGDTHAFLHSTVGTRYGSGLVGTFTSTTMALTEGDIWDEDLKITIGAQSQCRILYKDGSANWVYDEPAALYFKTNGSLVRYNNGNVLADVASASYCAYWIFATNDTTRPIVALMGQRVDSSMSSARTNNTYESLSFGALPYKEMKLLYRVIVRGNQTYQETQDLRSISNLPAGTYVATDHNTLTNIGINSHAEIDIAVLNMLLKDAILQSGYTKTTTFDSPTIGNITETLSFGGSTVATNVTLFDTPTTGQIQETITIGALSLVKVTTFNGSTSITEVMA